MLHPPSPRKHYLLDYKYNTTFTYGNKEYLLVDLMTTYKKNNVLK
jgi:hypothetical protein